MAVKLTATLERTSQFSVLVQRLSSPAMAAAAAMGLNEHAAETRRQSITRVSAFTGVPAGRIGGVTRVKQARAGGMMMAEVITRDEAIGLEEYGNPHWVRDLNPLADGRFGGYSQTLLMKHSSKSEPRARVRTVPMQTGPFAALIGWLTMVCTPGNLER